MGKNKLDMVKTKKRPKKSKKSKKSSKKKRKSLPKGIVDVPISKKISRGSKASMGSIDYHYQKYYNTFAFLKEILKKNHTLNNQICIPDVGGGWMQAFLKVHFMKGVEGIKSHMGSVKPVDAGASKDAFIKEVRHCLTRSRLVPINLEIIVPGVGTHANMILIDGHKKTAELFEPHGNRSAKSELEDISRAYFKVEKNVKRFFTLYLPDLTFIPPGKYEPKYGLQARLDAYSGLCVTWVILYMHYRILNPDVPPKKLINYLDKKVTRNFLLRYTKFVEDTLKHK